MYKQIQYSSICSDILNLYRPTKGEGVESQDISSLQKRLLDWKFSHANGLDKPDEGAEIDGMVQDERTLILFCEYHDAVLALHGGMVPQDTLSQVWNDQCLESTKSILQTCSRISQLTLSVHL